MTILRTTLSIIIAAASTLCASAAASILTVAEHATDSTIIVPESFETDTHKMMQNWYLRTYTALDRDVDSRPDVTTSDTDIISRLQSIPTTIELPFNSVVRNYIDLYTGRKRSLVETMLGMSLYYMPIFEEALEREGLPNELKYLPVIESALNPDAVSRAGATGLWQIMLPTARGLGLEVNTLVDERRDPIRSSEAATKYLRQLFEIYNDWSLAIAAYNCGPGNVNKAMRRAGAEGKDFWSIYPYLPAETRGYVPCFIAATYVMNFYNKHNISPALAKRPILTDSVHITKRVHFNQIADVLHIPVEELQILNPQYRKQIIPGDTRPCPLVLPANQTCSYIISENAILAHDASRYGRRDVVEPSTGIEPRRDIVDGQEGEWITTEDVKYHKVKRGETLASIAKKHGITLKALKSANGNTRKARRGQSLKIVTTKREFRPFEVTPPEGDDLLVKNPVELDATTVEPADSTAAPVGDVIPAAVLTPAEPVETNATTEAETAIDETAGGESGGQEAAATTAVESPSDSTATKVADTFRTSKAKQEASAKSTAQTAETKPAATKKKANGTKKSQAAAKTHTVRRGESLYKIAKKHGTTVKELQRLNNITGDKLKPGDKIRVK